MKVIEMKKYALEFSAEDWQKLGSLMVDFQNLCGEVPDCDSCPMQKFCESHEHPANYVTDLYDYLDNP